MDHQTGAGAAEQAVPLDGGMVLDITALDTIERQRPGTARVGAGHKMIDAGHLGFKRQADPLELLNPGKMRCFVPPH
ncbi:MAG TPA: hypothetical protein DDZ81_03470 [Acetobacteraceae bacterium]|nr:hypothetical protein [Acetobacteraceae bacterium]